jgi:hypothetical protein
VVLQGPQYKKHSFSWKLYPKSHQESIALQQIIKQLRDSMRTYLSDVSASAFFNFPKVFQLSFKPDRSFLNDGKSDYNEYLFGFKPAVLESMNVNYTPSNGPSFYGLTGAPDGVVLTLNFWELEYWLGSDPGMDPSTSLNAQRASGAITEEEFFDRGAVGSDPALTLDNGMNVGLLSG